MSIRPEEIRVAVLKGGRSAEREVSLNTGAEVTAALSESGFDVVEIDTGDDEFVVELVRSEADVAFICLHGRLGEDGTVQGLCELIELPYVGSGVLASALAMDKVMSKQFFTLVGIPTPEYVVLHRGSDFDTAEITNALGEKTVVKPANEGSAIGVTIAHSPVELPAAIGSAFKYDRNVLVEKFVAGVEVTVGVLGNEHPLPLPTLEIVPEHEFYDYDSKYLPGMKPSHHSCACERGRTPRMRAPQRGRPCRAGLQGHVARRPHRHRGRAGLSARDEHHPRHDEDLAAARCRQGRRDRVSRAVQTPRGARAGAAQVAAGGASSASRASRRGQLDTHDGPAAVSAADFNAPAGALGNAAHHRETQPASR